MRDCRTPYNHCSLALRQCLDARQSLLDHAVKEPARLRVRAEGAGEGPEGRLHALPRVQLPRVQLLLAQTPRLVRACARACARARSRARARRSGLGGAPGPLAGPPGLHVRLSVRGLNGALLNVLQALQALQALRLNVRGVRDVSVLALLGLLRAVLRALGLLRAHLALQLAGLAGLLKNPAALQLERAPALPAPLQPALEHGVRGPHRGRPARALPRVHLGAQVPRLRAHVRQELQRAAIARPLVQPLQHGRVVPEQRAHPLGRAAQQLRPGQSLGALQALQATLLAAAGAAAANLAGLAGLAGLGALAGLAGLGHLVVSEVLLLLLLLLFLLVLLLLLLLLLLQRHLLRLRGRLLLRLRGRLLPELLLGGTLRIRTLRRLTLRRLTLRRIRIRTLRIRTLRPAHGALARAPLGLLGRKGRLQLLRLARPRRARGLGRSGGRQGLVQLLQLRVVRDELVHHLPGDVLVAQKVWRGSAAELRLQVGRKIKGVHPATAAQRAHEGPVRPRGLEGSAGGAGGPFLDALAGQGAGQAAGRACTCRRRGARGVAPRKSRRGSRRGSRGSRRGRGRGQGRLLLPRLAQLGRQLGRAGSRHLLLALCLVCLHGGGREPNLAPQAAPQAQAVPSATLLLLRGPRALRGAIVVETARAGGRARGKEARVRKAKQAVRG